MSKPSTFCAFYHNAKEAGHERQATPDNVVTIIRRAGFKPTRRNSYYRILESFDPPTPIGTCREKLSSID